MHVHVWSVSLDEEPLRTDVNASPIIEIMLLRIVLVKMMRFAGSYKVALISIS